MVRPKLSPEEVELMMVERLVEAMYPVLIPIEQQDVHIQQRNFLKVKEAAKQAWRSFSERQSA